jgi:putative ABC transport system permease protein
VTEELKAIPGVKSVGATSAGPLFGGRETIEFAVAGQPEPPSGQYPVARYHNVSAGYFQTLGVPLLRGRDFTERDTDTAPKVVIVNETMARRFWPNGSPLGERIRLAESGDSYEIVGVVGDVQRLRMDARVEPEMYWTYLQQPRWASYFLLRTESDPAQLIPIVRARLAALDPDQIVSSISTMDTLVARLLRAPRFNMLLVICFAGAAVLLAAVGIYGVLAYAVTQRTHEIGVRMALGARKRDIFGLVLRQGMRLAALGVTLGAVGGLLVTRGLQALLFGVGAGDAATFAGVAMLLAAVALLACYVPARRAMRVEPVIALRYE